MYRSSSRTTYNTPSRVTSPLNVISVYTVCDIPGSVEFVSRLYSSVSLTDETAEVTVSPLSVTSPDFSNFIIFLLSCGTSPL